MGQTGYKNLTSLEDLRRFMAKLVNQRNQNLIPSAKYRDLFYGLKGLREVLEAIFLQSEVLERLARLEGETYVPPTLPKFNGSDDDEDGPDLDELNNEAEEDKQWA